MVHVEECSYIGRPGLVDPDDEIAHRRMMPDAGGATVLLFDPSGRRTAAVQSRGQARESAPVPAGLSTATSVTDP
jgi:hypothetical protein